MNEQNLLNRQSEDSGLLPAIRSDEFLPPISRWMTWGGLILMSTFGTAIALAAVVLYPVTVKANFMVRPSGELRIVEGVTEGTITQILVTENQPVLQGDILAVLDDFPLQTTQSKLRESITGNQLQLQQIQEQLNALDRQIVAETEKRDRTVAATRAELNRQQDERRERKLITNAEVEEARSHRISAEKELEKARLDYQSAVAALDGLNAFVTQAQAKRDRYQEDLNCLEGSCPVATTEEAVNLSIAQADLQKATWELNSQKAHLISTEIAFVEAIEKRDRYQPLVEAGAFSEERFREAQRIAEQQEQAIASQQARVKAQEQEISRQERAVRAAKVRLQDAYREAELTLIRQTQTLSTHQSELAAKQQEIQRQTQAVAAATARVTQMEAGLNPSAASVTIARENIEREKATGETTIERLNQEKQQLLKQQTQLKSQINQDNKDLEKIEIDLQNTVISAPEDGIIQKLNLRNPGQHIRPKDPIAIILPTQAPLQVKALIQTRDRDKVAIGQSVNLRVNACPYPTFGTLNGKVQQIYADVITPETNTAGDFYEVIIQPETTLLQMGDRTCSIQSGADGRADIISREESILTFILRKARLITDL
jgi:multidrug efflux pump subunit AcrA (membrane-fusion protein)